MDSVCRACLCIIKNGCVLNPVNRYCEVNARYKLETCVPEMSVDIVLEPVICKTCKTNLDIAYKFKSVCLETEKALLNYIQQRRQNENCTDLLNASDLLAMVRNDIIQEHSYSIIGKLIDEAEDISSVEQTVIAEEKTADHYDNDLKVDEDNGGKVEEVKRTLRPRRGNFKMDSDINANSFMRNRVGGERALPRKQRSICVEGSKSKSLVQKIKLSVHKRTHPFSCSICKLSFKQKALLLGHAHVHAKEKRFKCDKCPKFFSNKSALRIHLYRHKNKPYQCSGCNNLFKDFLNYKRHTRVHCNGAKKETLNEIENDLNEINKSVFGNDVDETVLVNRRRSRRLRYFCKVCNKGFTTNFSRNRHTMYQHPLINS